MSLHQPSFLSSLFARRCAAGLASAALGLGLALVPASAAAGGASPVLALHPNHFVRPPGASSGSAVGWTSSNWSGYAVTGKTYSSITAKWTVPSVAPVRGSTYSAAWAGIDGFNNNSLIQTGTEQDYYNGSAHYAAWWTTSAQNFAEQPIAQTVSPGDVMTATIMQTSGSNWSINLSDSRGWSFNKPLTYTGPGASAEWIMEAPTVGGRIATLAHYSSPTTFDPGTANGGSPGLTAADGGEIVSRFGQIVSVPSAPDHEADGFNMAYGSTAPAAPAS